MFHELLFYSYTSRGGFRPVNPVSGTSATAVRMLDGQQGPTIPGVRYDTAAVSKVDFRPQYSGHGLTREDVNEVAGWTRGVWGATRYNSRRSLCACAVNHHCCILTFLLPHDQNRPARPPTDCSSKLRTTAQQSRAEHSRAEHSSTRAQQSRAQQHSHCTSFLRNKQRRTF